MRTLTNFLIITFILGSSFASAQLGETCAQNLSIFVESAKVKNYDAAYDPWISVRNECPKASLAIYNYGERILKNRIKKSDGAAREKEVKDQDKAACIFCNAVTAICCLALPFLTIYVSQL